MRQLTVIFFLVFNICAYSQTPTVAASNIVFTFVGCNEVEISWTNGNGSDRVVFMREGSAVSDVPVYNEYYTEDQTFPIGEDIKDDLTNYCIFRGPGNSVKVKGLKNLTKYCIAVFEYNGGGGIYDYKTDAYPTTCITTKSIIANFEIFDSLNFSPNYDTGQACLQKNGFKFINKSTCDITPMNYTWDFADSKKSNNPNPSHTYAVAGIYQVKLSAFAKGCAGSVTKNDTVHPHPVAKYDLDPLLLPKNDVVQCYFGNRFTFRNQTTLQDIGAGLSSMRYEWYEMDPVKGPIQFATAYKADRAFPGDGTKTVKMVVISNKGCRDSTTRTYTVKPRAIDTTKVIISPKAMCLNGNLFNFKNNSPLSTSSTWFYRDSADKKYLDSSAYNKNPASYSFNKTGKFFITLRATDNNGCVDQWTDFVNIYKNSTVSFTGLKKEYCIDETPVPKLVPIPPKPDGIFSGTNVDDANNSFSPIGLGKFYVTYTSKTGCKESFTDSTIVYARPIIDLGNDTIICKDSPMQLNVNPVYNPITWTSNPPITGINGSSASFINVSQSATYSVTAVDNNTKCPNTDVIQITALGTPSLPTVRDTTLCGGGFLKFNFKVDGGTITWNDGNTDGARRIVDNGLWKVYARNKCGVDSASFTLIVEETACILFFPNAFSPNGDILNDTWQPTGKFEFIQMNIFNRWGEKVYFSDKSPVWNGYTNKDLCLEGVYMCVFEYLKHEGNSMKRVTEGVNIHLIK